MFLSTLANLDLPQLKWDDLAIYILTSIYIYIVIKLHSIYTQFLLIHASICYVGSGHPKYSDVILQNRLNTFPLQVDRLAIYTLNQTTSDCTLKLCAILFSKIYASMC